MWIEIGIIDLFHFAISVIPHVGMWIEIESPCISAREYQVIPHVGMWIEIWLGADSRYSIYGHPSRRDVD